MADTSAQSLKLSATELRTMTKWPDALIYEFLSLQSSVQEIIQNITIVINNSSTAVTLESQTSARVIALSKTVSALQEQSAALDALPNKISSLKSSVLDLTNGLSEQLGQAQALIARLQGKVSAQADQIAALSEQTTMPDFTLLSRLTREIDARVNLEQELHGS